MSLQARLTSFLMRRAQNRDGTAPSLERDALSASQIAEVLPKVAMLAGDAAGPARPTSNDIIAGVLSEKVLHGWSQNRNQTLHPLTLQFRDVCRASSRSCCCRSQSPPCWPPARSTRRGCSVPRPRSPWCMRTIGCWRRCPP